MSREGNVAVGIVRLGSYLVFGALLGAPLAAQVTERESLSSTGGEANGASRHASTSADGRFVAFESAATNLGPSLATNGFRQVFVRDRFRGTTEIVSVSSAGAQGNGDSAHPWISPDGRYVAFDSAANNLVAHDVGTWTDVFVRDRQLATTVIASVDSSGAQRGGNSHDPSISADGRYVAFTSLAAIAPDDTNGLEDVYVRDLSGGTTVRASVDGNGLEGDGASGSCSISADGQHVAFLSAATNLVAGDTNGAVDVFVRDLALGATERASVDGTGAEGNQDCGDRPAISADGRTVAFTSLASNLVAPDTNGAADVFVRDRQLGTTELASIDGGGGQGDGDSGAPALSPDGRFVAFRSLATSLVLDDANGAADVFVHDRQLGTTDRASVDGGGAEANGASDAPVISPDGRYVSFESDATNLVALDANGATDVFLHDRTTGLTVRASVGGGVEGDDFSVAPSVSGDGRYVAFHSQATDLVPGDTNGDLDVFVRDRFTGATERVSVGPGGIEGDGDSSGPCISPDGRYVVFFSEATNFVAGDTNGVSDAFLRDRQAGTTELISVNAGGGAADGPSYGSYGALISADGRYVAFVSDATNLVPGGTNGVEHVFLRDRVQGTTEIVSVSTFGVQGNALSFAPSMSSDARFVAFASNASNLDPADVNGLPDVFLRDRLLGTTELVSFANDGTQGDAASLNPSVSADGRYVAFRSSATNLVANDTNGRVDVFVRDRVNATTERESVDPGGADGDGSSFEPTISADGRFVAFQSAATNLVPGDTNGMMDVFVRDRLAGTTERASVATDGTQSDLGSGIPSMSADGRFVVFPSDATDLATGDTNAYSDVFLRDRVPSGFTSVCEPGVGSTGLCPCNNPPSGPGRGCDNSAGTGGAALTAAGLAYLSADSLVFTATGELSSAMSILVQGTALGGGGIYGRGLRCVDGTRLSLYVKAASGGNVVAPDFGAGDPSISARSAALGDLIQPGQSRWYFMSYRDPLGACPRQWNDFNALALHTVNATQAGRIDWSL
jgi:Tol biopolymer transport system component